jgi:enamine deaminase RidA (YjgF/YER057c/UK114 family)
MLQRAALGGAHYWRRNMSSHLRFMNPEAIAKPGGYSHVVEITGPGRIVYIAGQLGLKPDGKIAGDFRAQTIQAFENLKAALAAVGASFKDVVKINSYLADIAHLTILREVRAGYLNAAALPASTTLGGSSFAREGALLEVEVIVALSAKAATAKRASRKVAAKRAPRKPAKARGRRK